LNFCFNRGRFVILFNYRTNIQVAIKDSGLTNNLEIICMTEDYEKLLETYKSIPHKNEEQTFMDICQLTCDRFEERCSNILKFYFNPNNEHRLKGLFINSLIDATGKELEYTSSSVDVKTEEITGDNKRIDITIITDNFVIAIENKINAEVYNPLDSYREYVEQAYKDKKKIYVVLSVRHILDSTELSRIKKAGFIIVYYEQLLSIVKENIGNYIQGGNPKYITFLFDFIMTIENKINDCEQVEKNFFYQNKAEIEELIDRYNKFKTGISDTQKAYIAILKERITNLTGANWWIWRGCDLGIFFNKETHKIGIESSFAETKDNPIGEFRICITTWRKQDWHPYKEAVMKQFKDCYLDENADYNRVYLHLPIIQGENQDEIIKKLAEYQEIMQRITKEIK
jgi:hypothetical protein